MINNTIRDKQQQHEWSFLSEYAAKSDLSRRVIEETECIIRTPYQRDRDRIVHAKSFRRLARKTQVFINPDGDHYRTRLTHTLEVAQIARTISGALRLNADLTEAIALGHDLGHTPFGHIGEHALSELVGGFNHAAQSVRTVSYIENDGSGLNLTLETIDGIANHSSKANPKTLEGKVVRLSDKIAYVSHDIDDAIRAGFFTADDVPRRFDPLGRTSRERINTVITSIILTSDGKDDVIMEDDVAELFWGLRGFMFDAFYTTRVDVMSDAERAQTVIGTIYRHFTRYPEQLPESFAEKAKRDVKTTVCDYIAGMTDNFAIKEYERLCATQSTR